MCQMHTCHSLLFDVHRGGLVQFPQTSLREIATLKMLRHPNIVGLKEVVVGTERERCVCPNQLCVLAACGLKFGEPFACKK